MYVVLFAAAFARYGRRVMMAIVWISMSSDA
jgi:hypothetical protein